MKKNNYNFSHTSYLIINEYEIIQGIRKAKKILQYDDLLKSCDIGLSTVMIKIF